MFAEKIFKHIFANSNPNHNSHPNPNFNPNPKVQKHFQENEMMSFFGKVSKYLYRQASMQWSSSK